MEMFRTEDPEGGRNRLDDSDLLRDGDSTRVKASNDNVQMAVPLHSYALLHLLSISEIPTGSFVLTHSKDFS